MLNIEIIKFEAQDVITASTAAPVECICSDDTWYHHENYNNGVANHDFGDVK